MKTLLIFLFSAFGVYASSQDTAVIEKNIKEAVIKWADQTFVGYDNPRFENLMIFYSDAYQMWKMRPAMLESRKAKMKAAHEKGESNLSDEEYQKEIQNIDTQIEKVKERLSQMTDFADQFKISFWANIKTNDGITVQYEHIVTLDGSYTIEQTEINSFIGKKSDKTEILYR